MKVTIIGGNWSGHQGHLLDNDTAGWCTVNLPGLGPVNVRLDDLFFAA